MYLLSIIPDKPSLGTALFTTFITLMLIIYVLKVQKYPHRLPKNGTPIALFLCLLVLLFCIGPGDYFDYKEWVEHAGYTDINSIPLYYEHYEKPYYVIINIVRNNYFFFRLVVWGGALFLVYKAARILKLDKSIFIYYLAILVTINLTTSRIILAMAIAYFGLALIINPNKKKGCSLLSYIIGGGLIFISAFFHRSAMFMLVVLPLSLILKFNRKLFLISVLLFPLLVGVVNTNMINIVLNVDSDSLLDAGAAMYYMEADKRKMGIGGILMYALYYAPMALYLIVIIKNILDKSYNKWPSHVQKCVNASLCVIALSSVFLFTTSAETFKMFERLTAFIFIPMAFSMTYLFKCGYDKNMIRKINIVIIVQDIYNTLYLFLYLPLT